MWKLPFAGRNRVWCQRRLAAEFAALALSRFCGWDAYILVSCGIDGMIFYPRARLSKPRQFRSIPPANGKISVIAMFRQLIPPRRKIRRVG